MSLLLCFCEIFRSSLLILLVFWRWRGKINWVVWSSMFDLKSQKVLSKRQSMLFQEVMNSQSLEVYKQRTNNHQEEYWEGFSFVLELRARFTKSWVSMAPYDVGKRAWCPWEEMLHDCQRTGVYVVRVPHLAARLNTLGPFRFDFYLTF